MSSLENSNPELQRFVIVCDTVDDYVDPKRENFIVVPSTQIPIEQTQWLHFKYSVFELSNALKPYALEMLFERYRVGRVLYFDSDIRVYRRLNPIFEALEKSDIILTPHLTEPIADHGRPNELDILRAGTYNLGFIALANRVGGRAFLKWWQQKVFDECILDLDRGLNTTGPVR